MPRPTGHEAGNCVLPLPSAPPQNPALSSRSLMPDSKNPCRCIRKWTVSFPAFTKSGGGPCRWSCTFVPGSTPPALAAPWWDEGQWDKRLGWRDGGTRDGSFCQVQPIAAGPSLAQGHLGVLEQVMLVMSPSSPSRPGHAVPWDGSPPTSGLSTQISFLPLSRAGVCPFK